MGSEHGSCCFATWQGRAEAEEAKRMRLREVACVTMLTYSSVLDDAWIGWPLVFFGTVKGEVQLHGYY